MQAKLSSILMLCVLPCLMLSCKPGKPEGVMSEGKMEDVLYDYHMAQGLAQQMPGDSVNYYTRLYQSAVFEKYDLSQKDFDRSMEWYERHTELLSKIYERLAERMGDASAAHGSSTMLAVGGQSASGDTLEIWKGPQAVMLNSKGMNHFSFTEKVDTAVHAGDRLEWSFNADWYYHEGERTATACINIYYEGDSIGTTRQSLMSTGRQTVALRVGNRPIEKIECFIYQPAPWLERPRIINLYNFRLFRMRMKQAEKRMEEKEEKDSTVKVQIDPARRIRDSLLREDTLNRNRSHFK